LLCEDIEDLKKIIVIGKVKKEKSTKKATKS